MVSLTGLDPKLVRPRWQTEPPDIPDAFTAWCALGIANRPADDGPAFVHDGSGDGTEQLQRHETLELLLSFYDTGTNGQADEYAALLRDNLSVPQNTEILFRNGMGLGSVGELTSVPSLLKARWLYRVDVAVRIRRQVIRVYPVENLAGLAGTLKSETASVSLAKEVP